MSQQLAFLAAPCLAPPPYCNAMICTILIRCSHPMLPSSDMRAQTAIDGALFLDFHLRRTHEVPPAGCGYTPDSLAHGCRRACSLLCDHTPCPRGAATAARARGWQARQPSLRQSPAGRFRRMLAPRRRSKAGASPAAARPPITPAVPPHRLAPPARALTGA